MADEDSEEEGETRIVETAPAAASAAAAISIWRFGDGETQQ